MSDNDRAIGNPVQKAMEAVVEAWESALNKIRECKQEYQAQLEELAGMGGMPTPTQALGILTSFYERVKGLRNTLNQPAPHEALSRVEVAPANAAWMAAVQAAVTPAPRKRLTELVLPETQVAAKSAPVNAESSEQQGTTAEVEVESPTASGGSQGEEVNNRKDKGKDKAVDTSTTTTTTPTKLSGNSKSGSGSIVSKKDMKGKGRAKSLSPSPEPFSAKTLQRITQTVKKTNRLPLIKPVSMLKFARGAAAAAPSAPGPSRPEQRAATPEPEPESDSEDESVYLSVLQFQGSSSSPPDASSTPGPSSTSAAVAAASVSGDPTSNDTEEQPIVGSNKATSNVEVVDFDPTTAVTEESNSVSINGSVADDVTSNDIKETQDMADIEKTGENSIKDAKGKSKASDAPTKTTTTASGSGGIPSKKDLKGKGKAIVRSPSPVASSVTSNSYKVTKSKKDNKENKPFSRRSPPATGSTEPALNSKFNINNINNNNVQEEIIVQLDKGKGKAIETPTHIPIPTLTEDVNNKDEVIVTTTTAAPITTEASSNNNNKPSASTSTSTSGRGTIPSKKDLKSKSKATTTSPSPSPSRPPSPGPSNSAPKPKPKPTTNSTDKATITKVTKQRPTATHARQTIKRSLTKKGHHWAFKLESHFARSADDVAMNQDKYFILCCPAPNCPSPNFGGKHPFREGRAVAHFAAGGGAAAATGDDASAGAGEDTRNTCLMEIDGEEDDEKDEDGDVQMTEAEIFERFGAEIVQEQKRWPVDDKWALKNNRELCMKIAQEGEEREGMLREL